MVTILHVSSKIYGITNFPLELAEYLNIKQTTYSKYELGKINIPIEVFIKLADYYDVSIDYLVGRSIKKK